MYEHPSLTITAMLHDQEMLNRAVERRRAILERLERQGVPRPSWFARVRRALEAARRPETTACAAAGEACAADRGGARPEPGTASARRGATTSAREGTAHGFGADSDARRAPAEPTPADVDILVTPAR